jgi:predicted Zn-dependent protease
VKYLALCALLTAGCAGPSGPWNVDERFSEAEQAAIAQGAATWPVPIELRFGQHVNAFQTDARVIVRVDRDVMNVAYPESRGRNVRAVTFDQQKILLEPDTMNAPLWWTVAHELGHGMGIEDHVSDPGSVMYSTLDLTAVRWCVTEYDASAYRAATGQWMESTCGSQ